MSKTLSYVCRWIIRGITFSTILVFFPKSVAAQMVQGIVVAGERDCSRSDRIVIETRGGYVVGEVYGGFFDRGNPVIGELHSFGTKEVLVNGRSGRLYIDDYYLSRSSAIEKCAQ